ncbi:MAG: type IV toxin-antitoxin system AbiEi family antitoxin domain-containing protein [Solirubrobacterales bacterium]
MELAARQHGVAARRQLLAAGVSSSAIGRLIASGWLTRLHAGVYAVAGHPQTPHARWMAAVLACGAGAVLSHASAGMLWEIVERRPGPAHVTAPSGRHRRQGIILHRGRDLDVSGTVHNGIPVTTPSATILDLAAALSARRLERSLEAADRRELLDVAELSRICETRGRKGTRRLHSLLAQYRRLPATRSELERRFLLLCDRARLPKPAVNVPVEGLEVDCLWPAKRVVIELDGYEFHRGRAAFERDRRRDATLQLAGYRVLRVTHRRLAEDAGSVVAELRTLLGSPN